MGSICRVAGEPKARHSHLKPRATSAVAPSGYAANLSGERRLHPIIFDTTSLPLIEISVGEMLNAAKVSDK